MRRLIWRDAGAKSDESLREFARALSSAPIEQRVLTVTIPVGDTTATVSHGLSRAPRAVLVGALSTVAQVVALDYEGTLAAGGDPNRDVVVALPSAIGTDVTCQLLVL